MLNTFRIVKAADQANSGPGASGCGVAVVIRLQRAVRRGETEEKGSRGRADCGHCSRADRTVGLSTALAIETFVEASAPVLPVPPAPLVRLGGYYSYSLSEN